METALGYFRKIIRHLVESSSVRRDKFAQSISKAQHTPLGTCPDQVSKVLTGFGIAAGSVSAAVDAMANKPARFTVYNAVDSLTRITGRLQNAGDRVEQDSKIGQLLALAN